MQKLGRNRMPEPRTTFASSPQPCLQRFELPQNGQIPNVIGISMCGIFTYKKPAPGRLSESSYSIRERHGYFSNEETWARVTLA
ncbi:hypothetical protein FM037_00315 [Shewanella psychropiezotolerans]|uniref:Uncharacterized protein n=1 Tax=Shewanella psychropiezotolerans TaxID=2593655 RepID=A0ABX5WS73_9GAMM|nr:hypothetical protein FM037_00315 [Shewanella psychropiezotolerans]